MLKLRLIGFSDVLILNTVDLVGPEQVAKVKAWIGDHIVRIRVVEATF
jgi:G3E family GTPase